MDFRAAMSVQVDVRADIEAIRGINAVPLILDVVCRTTGMGFAAIARVTEDRWVACSVKDDIGFGLQPGGELEVATTICNEIRQSGDGVIFDDADTDPVYCTHHTPALYGLKSYISLPIRLRDGTVFGTLCAIDPKPRKVNTPEIIGMFKLFAELIAEHLHNNAIMEASRNTLAVRDAELSEANETAELREHFIAVLGHDLRNPLNAISSGARLLEHSVTRRRNVLIAQMIGQSAFRISEMVDNLLDFARGRLGGGISLRLDEHTELDGLLSQVVDELRIAWPDRETEVRFDFRIPVRVDANRIGQMVSNLMGNAFTHGDPTRPVVLKAVSKDDTFVLTVANSGTPIPAATMTRLFKPFERGSGAEPRQGLGLGLYIASEIARAHGGELAAESTEKETVFRFRMPMRADARVAVKEDV